MTDTTNRERKPKKTAPPRSYNRPQLRVYGALRDLTAGGSGSTAEGASGFDPNQQRP
jgi:hypothetical protein